MLVWSIFLTQEIYIYRKSISYFVFFKINLKLFKLSKNLNKCDLLLNRVFYVLDIRKLFQSKQDFRIIYKYKRPQYFKIHWYLIIITQNLYEAFNYKYQIYINFGKISNKIIQTIKQLKNQ